MPKLEAADALEAVESGRMGLNVKIGGGGGCCCCWCGDEPTAVVIANSEGGTGAWGNGGVVEVASEAIPVAALLWHFFDVMCDE